MEMHRSSPSRPIEYRVHLVQEKPTSHGEVNLFLKRYNAVAAVMD